MHVYNEGLLRSHCKELVVILVTSNLNLPCKPLVYLSELIPVFERSFYCWTV